MLTPELIDVIPVHNELGEGVIWDASRGAVWWTDIEGCVIYRYQFEAKHLERWQTPERLGCFAPVAGEDYLIAAFATGFAYFDPPTGYTEWLHRVEEDKPTTRLNDGRTDRQGRFWAGSMVESDSAAEDKGSLYCLDRQRVCSSKISDLSISNGLCWSPDSAYMYHADTPNGRIDRYDFDSETTALSNRVTFVETEADCWPDGSTIDAEGYLWNAQWGGSQVVRYSPDGEVDLVLPVPASQPTCVAFGGTDLSVLFVTSAKRGLDEKAFAEQADAGNVFVFATQARGLEESEFRPQ